MSLHRESRPAGAAVSADPDPRRAGLLVAAEAASVTGRERVKSVLVFAAGTHAAQAERVAAGAAEHLPGATIVVVGAAGVASADREAQAKAAVSALVLPTPCTVAASRAPRHEGEAEALGERLGQELGADASKNRPLLVFTPPAPGMARLVSSLERTTGCSVVAGGGLPTEGVTAACTPDADAARTSAVLVVRIDGGVRMAVGASPGVKPLSSFATVDTVDRGFVTSLGGRRPLEALTDAVRGRKDRPLVLAIVAKAGDPRDARPYGVVRGIAGVSPPAGAVHLGDGIEPGDQVAFAVLDATTAREDFGVMLRDLERGMAGGVPLAGVYFDCASRGARLYGRPDVDVRAIADRFRGLPFAGMRSTFELAPTGGSGARLLSYTGVLAMLYSPS